MFTSYSESIGGTTRGSMNCTRRLTQGTGGGSRHLRAGKNGGRIGNAASQLRCKAIIDRRPDRQRCATRGGLQFRAKIGEGRIRYSVLIQPDFVGLMNPADYEEVKTGIWGVDKIRGSPLGLKEFLLRGFNQDFHRMMPHTCFCIRLININGRNYREAEPFHPDRTRNVCSSLCRLP